MVSVIIFLATIFLLVVIHEWGHYCVAQRCHVKVLRFAFGFGKPLWQHTTKSGLQLYLGMFPLGGYVKLANEREAPVAPKDLPRAFNQQSTVKKISILSAGPFVNLLFALLCFWGMYSLGFKAAFPEIQHIIPDSIAAHAGLEAHDIITTVDNYPTERWQHVLIALLSRAGEHSTLKITSQNIHGQSNTHTLDLSHWTLDPLEPQPLKSLGLIPYQPPAETPWPSNKIRTIQYPLGTAIQHAFIDTKKFAHFNLKIIYKLLSQQLSLTSLASPFSLVKISKVAWQQGISVFMGFLAIFSVSLGVINLLPLPGLDGGHIVYCLLEALRKKPISLATEILLFKLSLILFIVLFIQATANDLVRLLY